MSARPTNALLLSLLVIGLYGGFAARSGAAGRFALVSTVTQHASIKNRLGSDATALDPMGCGKCHASEVAGFARSAMSRSMRLGGTEPSGEVDLPGTTITAFSSPTGTWQRRENGSEMSEYHVDYVVGSGNHANGYLIDIGNHLFQSPIAYYRSRHSYDLAPGFEGMPDPDFTRPITAGCLFCHSGGAISVAGTTNEYQAPPFTHLAISCNRCHGPLEMHLATPGTKTIINPARLEGAARDSICEQCHLIGVARVLNPGKQFGDFRPSEPLENTFTIYRNSLPAGTETNFRVISHSEQLASSMCARKSGGRLWCGTCHDPHNHPIQPAAYYRSKCLSCHTRKLSGSHPSVASNCIACHMPKRKAKDGSHTAFTDHRIQQRPALEQTLSDAVDIAAWREPTPALRKRNLAIAYIQVGAERSSVDFIVRGYRLLTEVQEQFTGDSALYSWMGTALLLGRQYSEAQRAFGRALMLDPNSATKERDLGQAYASNGEWEAAAHYLEDALFKDPLDLSAVALLMDIYNKQGQSTKAAELAKRMDDAMKQR